MILTFYKYQGAGNDFIIIDNRTTIFPENNTSLINQLCNRKYGIGADGLILLEKSASVDFKMKYYNADGKESTMCGNGGRCIVAFAKKLGVITKETTFEAIDGLHYATVINDLINLQMIDVNQVEYYPNHYFVNSGSPHHIIVTTQVKNCNVVSQGRAIRYGAPYFNEGANVNFVEKVNDAHFKLRTYERGVEDETLACGTGATAVAIAMFDTQMTDKNTLTIETLGGSLEVSFTKENNSYTNVFLKGPATFVFEGTINI
ncbi:MAG: diaminopimelate epimerase [Bacteroidetes bacterium]|jgi:diaminopimelate epimerase|nr:diaminopimelate epimerase [Bacteroidota bacterium]